MKKIIWSTVLCIMIGLGMVIVKPITSHAANVVEISTYEEWDQMLSERESGTTFKIIDDFDAPYPVHVPSGKSFVMDLNGHTITGKIETIWNEGNLTICDSKGGGTILRKYKFQKTRNLITNDGTLIVESGKICSEITVNDNTTGITGIDSVIKNNGTFVLRGGEISGIYDLRANTISDTDIYIIENRGVFTMSGGKVSGDFYRNANAIADCIAGIYSNPYSEMEITGGEVDVSAKVETSSNENTISVIVYGINIFTNSEINISNVIVKCEYENISRAKENSCRYGGIFYSGTKDANLTNLDVKVDIKGQNITLLGNMSGIETQIGTMVKLNKSKVVVTAEDTVDTWLVGINNHNCSFYIGESIDSNKDNTYIKVTGASAKTFGIAHVADFDENMILFKGTVSAKSAVLNEYFGLLQIGIDDGIINNQEIQITGSENALLTSEDSYLNHKFKINVYDGIFEGKIDDSDNILAIDTKLKSIGEHKYEVVEEITPISAFVNRLYQVCLNREPDKAGKIDWVERLEKHEVTGITAAGGFIFSQEFKNKNLCNEDYVEQLYQAFMGRASDEGGKAYWIGNLESGMTREQVFNGFAISTEFKNLCESYKIAHGYGIHVPVHGTIPTGTCTVCGKEDGVTAFVKRLYSICLNREADEGGLNDWTGQLWARTTTGKRVAFGFIFSQEFINLNLSNEDYVEYLYLAIMGRASDAGGKADWVNRLNNGWSRDAVFNGFAGSTEFNNICNSYGIIRE